MEDLMQIIDTVFKNALICTSNVCYDFFYFFTFFIKLGRKVEKVLTIYVMTLNCIVINLVVNRPDNCTAFLLIQSSIVLLRPRSD